MKKLVALALTLILALGCMGAFAEETTEIYFLNFKPEIAEVYEEIAAAYEAETGVHVNVVTAAAGTYEQTLRSEIAKADAPTIFQINGPVGLQSWKDYCLDLADTEFYNMLSDKTLAVKMCIRDSARRTCSPSLAAHIRGCALPRPRG